MELTNEPQYPPLYPTMFWTTLSTKPEGTDTSVPSGWVASTIFYHEGGQVLYLHFSHSTWFYCY